MIFELRQRAQKTIQRDRVKVYFTCSTQRSYASYKIWIRSGFLCIPILYTIFVVYTDKNLHLGSTTLLSYSLYLQRIMVSRFMTGNRQVLIILICYMVTQTTANRVHKEQPSFNFNSSPFVRKQIKIIRQRHNTYNVPIQRRPELLQFHNLRPES